LGVSSGSKKQIYQNVNLTEISNSNWLPIRNVLVFCLR
jgi:hypothetical protein